MGIFSPFIYRFVILSRAKGNTTGFLQIRKELATRDPVPGTPEGDRLELLAKLVEDYEVERFRFRKPDPLAAIRFRMQEQGLRQKDLAPILGGKNRVSEILSGKRSLTLAMVRALNEALDIPAELLIREPKPPGYRRRKKPGSRSIHTARK